MSNSTPDRPIRRFVMRRLVFTALLALALAIALAQGHGGDAIAVGVALVWSIAVNIFLFVRLIRVQQRHTNDAAERQH